MCTFWFNLSPMSDFTNENGGGQLESEEVLAESPDEIAENVRSVQRSTARFIGKVWVDGRGVFDADLQFRMARILAYRSDFSEDDMVATEELAEELGEDAAEIHAHIKGLKKGLRRLGMKLNSIITTESNHAIDEMLEDDEGTDESGVFWLAWRKKHRG